MAFGLSTIRTTVDKWIGDIHIDANRRNVETFLLWVKLYHPARYLLIRSIIIKSIDSFLYDSGVLPPKRVYTVLRWHAFGVSRLKICEIAHAWLTFIHGFDVMKSTYKKNMPKKFYKNMVRYMEYR